MWAVPHYVLGGSADPFAGWVVTFVRAADASGVEPIIGADAASNNCVQEPSLRDIGAIAVVGVLFGEIAHGGVEVNVRLDADHVFAVARGFRVISSALLPERGVLRLPWCFVIRGVIVPADTLLEVPHERVSGGFPN